MNYYSEHSDEYISNTIGLDMSLFYPMLLKSIPQGGTILDVGFGSGRDSIYFDKHGYDVYSIDTCDSFVNHLKKYKIGHVYKKSVLEIDYKNKFDGIWANAALVNLNKVEIKDALIKLRDALKPNGVIYASFKYGTSEGYDELGRYNTYLNESQMVEMLSGTQLFFKDMRIAKDTTRKLNWLDVVLRKE